MRMRRWISAVAIVGVLLHGALIVRHTASVLAAQLQHNDLVAALGVICHADGSTMRIADADLPSIPPPSPDRSACPICAGMSPAGAVLPDIHSLAPPQLRLAPAPFASPRTLHVDSHAVRPPTRGPPSPA